MTSRKGKIYFGFRPPTRFNDLPDCVLEEILRRLPLISAHRSKLVCKRWHSIMSQPYFADLFSQNKKLSSSVFVYCNRKQHMYKLFSDSDFEYLAPYSLNAGLSLNFKNFINLEIVASSDDLILWRHGLMGNEYFVYNIVTKDWVRLPGVPALIFLACISFATKGDGEFAMIVVFEDRKVQENELPNIIVKVLSSKTFEWVQTKLPYPPRVKNRILSLKDGKSDERLSFRLRLSFYGLSYKGFSLWMDIDSRVIIGIDPFNLREKNSWFFIDPPKDFIPSEILEYLGVCRGNLRICQISMEDRGGDLILRVWDLKDMEWVLHHQSSLWTLLLNEPNLNIRNLRRDYTSCPVEVVGCDPNDPNIIIFSLALEHLFFNMSTRQIKPVLHRLPTDEWILYDVIPFKLQWQPTWLPG